MSRRYLNELKEPPKHLECPACGSRIPYEEMFQHLLDHFNTKSNRNSPNVNEGTYSMKYNTNRQVINESTFPRVWDGGRVWVCPRCGKVAYDGEAHEGRCPKSLPIKEQILLNELKIFSTDKNGADRTYHEDYPNEVVGPDSSGWGGTMNAISYVYKKFKHLFRQGRRLFILHPDGKEQELHKKGLFEATEAPEYYEHIDDIDHERIVKHAEDIIKRIDYILKIYDKNEQKYDNKQFKQVRKHKNQLNKIKTMITSELERHKKQALDEGFLDRFSKTVEGSVGGGLAGFIGGGLGGAALTTLTGIPDLTKIGLVGGTVLGSALGSHRGLRSAIEDEIHAKNYQAKNQRFIDNNPVGKHVTLQNGVKVKIIEHMPYGHFIGQHGKLTQQFHRYDVEGIGDPSLNEGVFNGVVCRHIFPWRGVEPPSHCPMCGEKLPPLKKEKDPEPKWTYSTEESLLPNILKPSRNTDASGYARYISEQNASSNLRSKPIDEKKNFLNEDYVKLHSDKKILEKILKKHDYHYSDSDSMMFKGEHYDQYFYEHGKEPTVIHLNSKIDKNGKTKHHFEVYDRDGGNLLHSSIPQENISDVAKHLETFLRNKSIVSAFLPNILNEGYKYTEVTPEGYEENKAKILNLLSKYGKSYLDDSDDLELQKHYEPGFIGKTIGRKKTEPVKVRSATATFKLEHPTDPNQSIQVSYTVGGEEYHNFKSSTQTPHLVQFSHIIKGHPSASPDNEVYVSNTDEFHKMIPHLKSYIKNNFFKKNSINEIRARDILPLIGNAAGGALLGGLVGASQGTPTSIGTGALIGGSAFLAHEYMLRNKLNAYKDAEKAYTEGLKTHDKFSMSSHERMNKLWTDYRKAQYEYEDFFASPYIEQKYYSPKHQTIPFKP